MIDRAPADTPPRCQAIEYSQLTVTGLPADLHQAVRRALTMPNPRYDEAIRHDRWTGGLDEELEYYRWLTDGRLIIPRGAGGLLRELCQQYGVELELHDQTLTADPVEFTPRLQLSTSQE